MFCAYKTRAIFSPSRKGVSNQRYSPSIKHRSGEARANGQNLHFFSTLHDVLSSRITHTLTMTSIARSTQVAHDHMRPGLPHPFRFGERPWMRKCAILIGQQARQVKDGACASAFQSPLELVYAPERCATVLDNMECTHVRRSVVGWVERERPLGFGKAADVFCDHESNATKARLQ